MRPFPPRLAAAIRFAAILCLSLPAFSLKADNAPTPHFFNRLRYLPLPGHEKDVLGAKILASNTSPSAGFQELAGIIALPPPGQWGEITIPTARPWRWIKYLSAPGTHARVSKLELYAGDQKLNPNLDQLTASYEPNKWDATLNPTGPIAHHESPGPDNQYVVIDLGNDATGPSPTFSPPQTESTTPIHVTIKTATPGAVIRYTLDGTIPALDNSLIYTAPLTIDKTTTICAASFAEGLAPTPPAYAVYIIGAPDRRQTLHFGNSLTGVTRQFDDQARTAGAIQHSNRFLIGGVITKALWNSAMGKIGDPNNKNQWIDLYGIRIGQAVVSLSAVQQAYKDWTKLWPTITEIDDLIFQPRDFDIPEEADYENRFLNLALQKSPQLQPWLYGEWVEQNFGPGRPTNTGKEPTSEMKTVYPALTWEEAMSAMTLYEEDLKRKVDENYKGAKPLRIIPAGLAMGWLYNMIDHGRIPGLAKDDFYRRIMGDEVHPSWDGAYLVDCMFYTAFYGESPVGKFLPLKTHLTAAQAGIMQHLAWDTMRNYPPSGFYKEGTTPVAAPRFSPDAQPIKVVTQVALSSSTQGAWFRYTLDGTPPTRTNGYVYCGIISARPGMTIKAIAYKNGMADSPVTKVTYPGNVQ